MRCCGGVVMRCGVPRCGVVRCEGVVRSDIVGIGFSLRFEGVCSSAVLVFG